MIVKLKKISPKPFVLLTTIVYAIAGLMIGIFFTLASLVAPPQEGPNLGPWALLFFPLLNTILGALSSWMMCLMYNILSGRVGALEFEVEESAK